MTLAKRRVRPDIRRREQAAGEICRERGWRYVVHTERSLPNGSELANLLALAGYRPTIYANQAVIQSVYEQLSFDQAVGLDVLVRQLGQQLNLPQAVVIATLCYLLWHGDLQTDLKRLLFDQGDIEPGVQVWLIRKEPGDEG